MGRTQMSDSVTSIRREYEDVLRMFASKWEDSRTAKSDRFRSFMIDGKLC